MGADTTRITATDFVTPPEFAHLQLAAEGAGRIGGVRLGFLAESGRTRVQHCYQQVPLHTRWLDLGPAQPLLTYLVNPTAGLLDGDGHLVQIEAGPETRTLVVGQSAGKIHPAVRSFCTQQWQVHVHSGAVLVVLPGPTIPYRACRYFGRAAVALEPAAHLIWGDLWLAGRHAEPFQFERLLQEMIIRREGHLIFRDRFCWAGPWDQEAATWHLGSQLAYGSLFVTGSVSAKLLPDSAKVNHAIFETAEKDTLLRWCGPAEAVTKILVQTALTIAGTRVAPAHPKPWLRDSHQLAPNHWFTPCSNSR